MKKNILVPDVEIVEHKLANLEVGDETCVKFSEGEMCVKCGSTDKDIIYRSYPSTNRQLKINCRCGYTYFRACLDDKQNDSNPNS